jgi:hypothetical protein
MDFPTTFDGVVATHLDPTPLPTAGVLAAALGSPGVVVSAPASVVLTATPFGVNSASFTVSNSGTWIAPFRIRTTADWLVVRHPGDATTRTLDGGIAVGADTEVVTQSPSAGPPARPRIAQAGHASQLILTADPERFDSSDSRSATVWIEPILGGPPVSIAVTLEGDIGPIVPRPEMPHRRIVPWVSSEPTN